MRITHTVLTVILGVALIVSLALWRKSQRQFQQELHAVNDANVVLRDTLGQLTIAITNKDKQIDHLYSSCSAQEKTPNSFRVPFSREPQPAKPPRGSIGAN